MRVKNLMLITKKKMTKHSSKSEEGQKDNKKAWSIL